MALKATPPSTIKKQQRAEQIDEKSYVEKKKEFVQEADKHVPIETTSTVEEQACTEKQYPWTKPSVREDVTKLFNIRLRESDWLKLKYISEHTNESMHTICLDTLIPMINKKLKKLLVF